MVTNLVELSSPAPQLLCHLTGVYNKNKDKMLRKIETPATLTKFKFRVSDDMQSDQRSTLTIRQYKESADWQANSYLRES